MKAIYSISVIVAAVVLLVLCVHVHASQMDSRIESSAKQSYVFKTYLQGDDIKIQSRDGAVILTGIVSEESHKSLAGETVEGLPGVKSVDNRLEVKGESSAMNSDSWLATKVKTTLLFHENVSALTEVSVKDGIVTLRGEAANQAQKDLTTEYARDVEGVKYVKNEMTISANSEKTQTLGEKIDDASITAQVKITLLFHRSTSAVNTKVETNNGVVTLYGKASNKAEKDLATKLVSDVKGVKSVNNQMTIGESK
jgi:hyperosmotically inducible protein